MPTLSEQILAAARGRKVHLTEGAPPLVVLRLTNRFDAEIDQDDLANAGILFITEATKEQLTEPTHSGGAFDVEGTVVNLAGEIVGEPGAKLRTNLVRTVDLADLTKAQVFVMGKLHADLKKLGGRGGAPEQACRGRALIAFFKAGVDDAQEDLRSRIEGNRWEVSHWSERDRDNLTLTDKISGQEVFSLWDENFRQAVEDGFLSAPRFGRNDSDWLQPAIDYADDQGLLAKFTLEPPPPARSAPVTAQPEDASAIERPRAG